MLDVRVSFIRLFFFGLVVFVFWWWWWWWLEVGGCSLGHMGCGGADFWFVTFISSTCLVLAHDWLEHSLEDVVYVRRLCASDP